ASIRPWLALSAALLVACGEDALPPLSPPLLDAAVQGELVLRAVDPTPPAAVAGRLLEAPEVELLVAGTPAPDVPIRFSVREGDVVLRGARTRTDDGGRASATELRAGSRAGAFVLAAEVEGAPEVSVLLAGEVQAGPAAQLRVVDGDGQRAAVGALLPAAVVVGVADSFGNPVAQAGVAVSFTALDGGRAAPSIARTDEAGMARATWTLGDGPGAQTLRAIAEDQELVFEAFAGEARPFEIDLLYDDGGALDASVRAALEEATDRWSALIAADVPEQTIRNAACGIPEELLPRTVDDLLLVVRASSFDGERGVLASAGPRCLRSLTSGRYLPAVGELILDTADLPRLAAQGQLGEVLLHEVGHVLGLGTGWDDLGLLRTPGCGDAGCVEGRDTRYLGASGRAGWEALGGSGEPPVENAGGSGTLDRHWRESVLGNELMTSVIGPAEASNPLSGLSFSALGDLGYALAGAPALDAFSMPLGALRDPEPADTLHMESDGLEGPRFELTNEGVRQLP
ncbi:MAG: hypothetical protein AAF447_14830, partial [Myxococcota bacterium]